MSLVLSENSFARFSRSGSDAVSRPDCCGRGDRTKRRDTRNPGEIPAYFGPRAAMTHRSRLQVFELIREMGMT
jgi:hypothetical protein